MTKAASRRAAFSALAADMEGSALQAANSPSVAGTAGQLPAGRGDAGGSSMHDQLASQLTGHALATGFGGNGGGEDRLRRLLESLPIELLDPGLVDDDRFPNRDPLSFQGPEWEEYLGQVRVSGGNVQAGLVIPHPSRPGRFQIVFGRRRRPPVLELGLPFRTAISEPLDDRACWMAMEMENTGRRDPSPYEQGLSYKMALEAGIFSSLSELARALGRDAGSVSRYLRIASLPAEVLDAFPSRNSIQKRWADELDFAMRNGRDEVLVRARGIREEGAGMLAEAVLAALVGPRRRVPLPRATAQSRAASAGPAAVGRGAEAGVSGKSSEATNGRPAHPSSRRVGDPTSKETPPSLAGGSPTTTVPLEREAPSAITMHVAIDGVDLAQVTVEDKRGRRISVVLGDACPLDADAAAAEIQRALTASMERRSLKIA